MLANCCVDESRIDDQRLAPAVLGAEADVLEQFLHHRLQPSRADILERFVDLGGDPASAAMPSSAKVDGNPFGAEQRLILLGQAGAGGRQDADEILLRQRLQFDRIGRRPWSSGSRSAGLAMWKRPRR